MNGGSLEKHILARYGAPVPEAMVESAMYHVRLLEKHDFNNIVISIKSSNVPRMMAAYRLLASQTDYPLHVGVTEAGGNRMGLINWRPVAGRHRRYAARLPDRRPGG